ncbi:IS630 family transposase [Acidiphilium acidophilum]|uniref:IS630 family transposase n=1 Tax=Acidiphilium acidophilum TaxID=76588 RepID=UPI002E8E71F6|nr:IS630 family transposase [Acidiphilium acidophilum]MEE3501885.1 IS630 family transposase [Acidiphilium acidophilum]MEE3502967.1 IS630 family transposase [Acidiphilium acidophilum]MEE3502970.1 IS630 family transposase [Acidiphilium acidophilum]MEE3504125.1 IS630 family transposase [Acidiphilium acidophilum]
MKKYIVRLRDDERAQLNALIGKGKHSAQKLLRARILLKADASEAGPGWPDRDIAAALDTSIDTVAKARQLLVEEGLDGALTRKHSPASARRRIFDGAAEAKLIALACSAPPSGRTRWTLELLEEAVVELKIVDRASDNTIGRNFKKNTLKPHLQKQWVIPPDTSAAFVAAMEDVLEVYHRPHDPTHPVVCLDETSKQLIAETRSPIPAKPGSPARHDYEYERNGTANLFMLFAPLEGWRHVEVTDRHTAVDYAEILRDLSDKHFPDAARIVLVQDNLNTHKPASLYEAFPAAEARRLVERFEWHYTPKHGSWLDMAETELSVLATQCLNRRIADKQTLINEVAAWEISRNQKNAKADWQFTADDARVKLKRLYPVL